jgi:hypothetical protein
MFSHKISYQVMMFPNPNAIIQTDYQPSNKKHKVNKIIVVKGKFKQIKILFTENFTRMKGSKKTTKCGQ